MTKRGRPNVRQSFGRIRQLTRWTLAGVLALAGGGTALASPAAFTFTLPNEGWVPVLQDGQVLSDPEGDTPGSRDIVGDQDNPMLYVAADETHLYFRLRVDSEPLQSATNFSPFGWGCFINIDSDLATYEFSTIIDGVNNPDQISFFKNTTTGEPNSPDDEPDLPPVSTTSSPLTVGVRHAQVVEAPSTFGGNTDYFIEWAIERSAANAAGFDTSTPASYYCGSSNNGSTVAADCSGSTSGGCPLDSQFSDPVSCSDSGCGICGDGEVGGSEGCDDGALVSGDGCSDLCLIELGEPCSADATCESGFCDPDSDTCECDSDADCAGGELCSTALVPNSCVAPGCGNAVLEGGEGCDDGNVTPGDGCNDVCLLELGEDCTLAAECASGFCDPFDATCACDDLLDCPLGELCRTEADPNACVPPGCGNALLELGEACDDGNTSPGDGCDGACLRELNQPCDEPEECASEFCSTSDVCACDDDGDCAVGQDCIGEVCASPTCGDSTLDTGEGCDDGNTNDGDGCNAQCLLELGEPCGDSAECASAFCDPENDTCACDQIVDCPAGQLCDTVSDPNLCVDPGCGNNVVEAGEGCDDGNMNAADGCSAECLLELAEPCTDSIECESGFCDPANSTCSCNEASDCAVGQLCDEAPEPNLCVDPGCGNGVLEAGEGCDDGNTSDGDGCTAGCLLELAEPCVEDGDCDSNACDDDALICVCDEAGDCANGEVCDTEAEPAVCVAAGCGNGVLEPGEGCDDANFDNLDGCTTQCLLELGEPCTDGAECASALCDGETDVCTCADDDDCLPSQVCNTVAEPNVCVAPGCGNSLVEDGESCDDGNTAAGDGCDATCLLELGEACEDNAECASGSCDSVDNVCECNQDSECEEDEICNQVPDPNECIEPSCGDGLLQVNEACDDGNALSGDGCSASCLIELGEDCEFDDECESGLCDPTSALCACDDDGDCDEGQLCDTARDPNLCVSVGCGNGVVEGNEACDDANLIDGDGCSSACLRELGEECGADDDCESGMCDPTDAICVCDDDDDCDDGEVCNAARDPNQCVNLGCGNGVVEGNEGCDDGNLVDGDGCNGACLIELGEDCGADDDCDSGLCDPTATVCVCNSDGDCAEGEVCDEDRDPNQCVSMGCGNGVVEGTEGCDDANLVDGDGCNAACLVELGEECDADADCDSGSCDPTATVCVCDDDDDCADGELCETGRDPNQCISIGCGNGVVEGTEGCDDANLTDGDGCSSACLVELGEECDDDADCDSGFCDPTGAVCTCDDDGDCGDDEFCDDESDSNQCVSTGCGNGVVEGNEGCDDANRSDGDGCSAACLIELGEECEADDDCESGHCDPADLVCACDDDGDCGEGEICDDDRDPNECVSTGCGNGVVEGDERCDDANRTDGDGCSAECLIELGEECEADDDCASGLCDPTGDVCACDDDDDCGTGEICEDDRDPNQCVGEACGDGVIDTGETCDDANLVGGDGCSITCAVEPGFECMDEPSECEETGCQVDSDCSDRQICDAGECVAVECTRDAHCGSNETCEVESHTCGECSTDSDCGPDFVCDTRARECRDRIFASGGGVDCSVHGVGDDAPATPASPLVLLGLAFAGGVMRRRRRAGS